MQPLCAECRRLATHQSTLGHFCSSECHATFWARQRQQRVGSEAPLVPSEPEPTYVHVDHVDMNAVSLSREDLGRAFWTCLHALFSTLEDDPATNCLDPQTHADILNQVAILTRLYPCLECRGHFAAMVKREPPRGNTAAALKRWLCERHNEVNRRLGKPEVPFSEARDIACSM